MMEDLNHFYLYNFLQGTSPAYFMVVIKNYSDFKTLEKMFFVKGFLLTPFLSTLCTWKIFRNLKIGGQENLFKVAWN